MDQGPNYPGQYLPTYKAILYVITDILAICVDAKI